MTRVKRGCVARKRRNRIAAVTAGAKRALSRLARPTQQQAIKSLVYAHHDRRTRKRAFRHLWVVRMNAAARQQEITYSDLIHQLHKVKVLLNRKMLAQIAVFDNSTWITIVRNVRTTASNATVDKARANKHSELLDTLLAQTLARSSKERLDASLSSLTPESGDA